jgi:hypothetical protein
MGGTAIAPRYISFVCIHIKYITCKQRLNYRLAHGYVGPEVNGNQVSNIMMIGMGQA